MLSNVKHLRSLPRDAKLHPAEVKRPVCSWEVWILP